MYWKNAGSVFFSFSMSFLSYGWMIKAHKKIQAENEKEGILWQAVKSQGYIKSQRKLYHFWGWVSEQVTGKSIFL